MKGMKFLRHSFRGVHSTPVIFTKIQVNQNLCRLTRCTYHEHGCIEMLGSPTSLLPTSSPPSDFAQSVLLLTTVLLPHSVHPFVNSYSGFEPQLTPHISLMAKLDTLLSVVPRYLVHCSALALLPCHD